MTGRLWLAVACVALVAACGSPAPTPPPSAAPTATADPRVEDLTKERGAWDKLRPRTVAYTTIETWTGMSTSSIRVTEMDGRAEVQPVALGSYPPPIGPDQTVEGIFDRAATALAGDKQVSIAYDPTYGYIANLDVADAEPSVADGAWSVAIADLVTPADRRTAAQARDGLDELLRAWGSPPSSAWEYTWSRYTAADTPATSRTWVVHDERGKTTITAGEGSTGAAAGGEEATIRGTVEAAIGVLAAGGWLDVAMDPASLDTLIAVDPSPSMTGDAYWIRIDVTDLSATRAREALKAARERWAAAALVAYRYTWRWEDADGASTYKVSVKAGVATIKPGPGARPAAQAAVPPRIDALFDAIDGGIAEGIPFDVTYDAALGYPTKVSIPGGSEASPEGVITITGFKPR